MPFVTAFSEHFLHPKNRHRLMNVHVSLAVTMKSTGEVKTKPMQNGIRNVRASGLIPDLIMVRSEQELTDHIREKIAGFSQVERQQVHDYIFLLLSIPVL